MKRKKIFCLLVLLMITLLLLTAFPGDEPTATATPTATPTATAPANWWDKFGEPQYGGTITVQMARRLS